MTHACHLIMIPLQLLGRKGAGYDVGEVRGGCGGGRGYGVCESMWGHGVVRVRMGMRCM